MPWANSSMVSSRVVLKVWRRVVIELDKDGEGFVEGLVVVGAEVEGG